MEKTIKEWLETLPEPYRSEAIENASEMCLPVKRKSLSLAITSAFYWSETKQGLEYWDSVRNRAEAGEFNTYLLDKDSEK